MSKDRQPLPIHSLAEAYLYARVAACTTCAGPLEADDAWFDYDAETHALKLEALCRQCGATFSKQFDASGIDEADLAQLNDGRPAAPWEVAAPKISQAAEASRVIDVAGWLALFSLVSELVRSASEPALDFADPSAVRRMRLVAAACLEEALKFFEDDNDLPPDDAFFTNAARQQFWERPQLFTRQHIADLRFSLLKSPPQN